MLTHVVLSASLTTGNGLSRRPATSPADPSTLSSPFGSNSHSHSNGVLCLQAVGEQVVPHSRPWTVQAIVHQLSVASL
eukprot:scaffold53082_cov36-Phaeocystis_antarctica.AAC.2